MDNNHDVMDSYESTENALLDSFKAAALKVTTLYKDSLAQNRKAYAAGYQQALQDLYEFLSSTQQPEQGFIPVEDVLQFARQRNNQLVSEIKGTPQPVQPQPQPQKEHPKASPFQIDPHAQFTFTHEIANPRHDVWDTAAHLSDNNKRRWVMPNELSFMGRSMNLDILQEQPSPFKRGRTRRDDQDMLSQSQSMQAQQQQQQQQQQQHYAQQLQLQQQQQQFAQQQHQSSFQSPFYQQQQPPPPL
ncbi:hypothetical protein A0J61_05636 [Choanephora cucurbitarum]|uniref:Uncharacterized protein n=1 Tax=Choanephora cucurbitarum TaxID=101091 RepID=A0A1C7NG32_9FUNG|nr:hypothetical protein A0J61_05636 [Choanephora cucurbitarum]